MPSSPLPHSPHWPPPVRLLPTVWPAYAAGENGVGLMRWQSGEKRNGRNKMPTTANNGVLFVLTDTSSFWRRPEWPDLVGQRSGFYQLLGHSAHQNRGLNELGDRLVILAEHARAFQRLNE